MPRKTQRIRRSKPNWSNLPVEIAGKIADNLKFHGCDHRRFRAVCRNWRHSSSPSTQFLISDFPLKIPSISGEPNFLISSVVYILYNPLSKKSKPWIISIEEYGKLKIHHPITNNLINFNYNFPKSLNLLDFGSRIVDTRVNLRFTKSVEDVFSSNNCRLNYWKNYPIKTKSILLNSDGVVMILLLYLRGALGTVKVNEEWKFMEFCPDCLFDDIVEYKGGVCAISNLGTTWVINDFQGKGCPGDFSQKLCKFSYWEFNQRRKLLAVCDGELYMIARGSNCQFRVFKLNEELHEWERVFVLGDKMWVVTYDEVLFIDTCYLPGYKGNCILFPKNCFPTRGGENSDDDELFRGARKHQEIGVYNLDDDSCQLISSYPDLLELFWPPPSWLLSVSCSASRFRMEDEEMDSCSHISSEEQSISTFSQHGKNEQGAEDLPTSSCQKDTALREVSCANNDKSAPAINFPRQIFKSGAPEENFQRTDVSLNLAPHIPSLKQVGADSLLPTPSSVKEKFQGVDISSNMVPVLQKIWDKYGNIIEGHIVHSNVLLTWALESLAKMILILEKNTGDSLTNSQAEYLNSTLADLQMMQFRLDWLVPFVKRALAVHKRNCQKAIMINLETRKSKLLAEMRELEEQMAQQEKLMAESLIDCAPSVMEKGLAEGLY